MATLNYIKQLINDKRRDNTSNSINMDENGFRAINSTLDLWNSLHDWPWTVETKNIDYNANITWYPLDALPEYKSPLTIEPYKNQDKQGQNYWMTSDLKFDSAHTKPKRFADANLDGKRYLRIKTVDGNYANIQTATQHDKDGEWVGTGGISNVGTDSYEYFDLPGSVSFDFNGTTGTLTNSTFQKKDLDRFANRSNLYVDIFIPEVDDFKEITLRWGSSDSDYYEQIVDKTYLNEDFIQGWNRVKFEWKNVTTEGTPNNKEINFLELVLEYNVSKNIENFRIQNFFVSENIPLTLTYYSVNMVKSEAGVKTQRFTNPANGDDFALWSGRDDAVTESFVNSVMEIIFWMTGEYTDYQVAQGKVREIIEPLKNRYPSRKRYPATFIVTDTNL